MPKTHHLTLLHFILAELLRMNFHGAPRLDILVTVCSTISFVSLLLKWNETVSDGQLEKGTLGEE